MATAVTQAGGEIIWLPVASRTPSPCSPMRGDWRSLSQTIRSRWSMREAAHRPGARSSPHVGRRPFVTTYHGGYSSRAPLKMFYSGVTARGDRVIANSRYTAGLIAARHHVRWNACGWSIAASTSHALPPARSRRTASMRFELHGRQARPADRSACSPADQLERPDLRHRGGAADASGE